jgi:hypothetical protein
VLGEPLLGEGHDQDAVGGPDPHAHDGAHQHGHAQRGVGQEEEHDDARQRGGQRRDDDERIEPGLEVHDVQQVDEHDREGEAAEEADVGGAHGFDHPAQTGQDRVLRLAVALQVATLDLHVDRHVRP